MVITAPASGTATLTWDPETSVAGYKAYTGTSSNVYGAPVDVGNVTTFQIFNLQSGKTYYFALSESFYFFPPTLSLPVDLRLLYRVWDWQFTCF